MFRPSSGLPQEDNSTLMHLSMFSLRMCVWGGVGGEGVGAGEMAGLPQGIRKF